MAFGPSATKPRPGSVISPFCEPVTATSTPQPSISNGMVPRVAMVSSRNSAAVSGGVDRLADGGDVVCRARRGVDLDHQNRLDRAGLVLLQLRLGRRGQRPGQAPGSTSTTGGKHLFSLAKNIYPPGCPQGCDANFAYRSAAFRLTAGGALPKSAVSADRSEEHTSELQSLMRTSYAVLSLKKQNTTTTL